MRTEYDALLSVQRFFAQNVLPEPWDVRTDVEAGDPPERPFALIESLTAGETTGPPVTQDLVLPVTVNLYLPKGATRAAGTVAAFAMREQVWTAVKYGPDDHNPTTDRIPLYCYSPRLEWHRFKVDGSGDDVTITIAGVTTDPIAPASNAATVAAAIASALDADPDDVFGQDKGTGLWDVVYGGALAGERPGVPTMTAGTPTVILEGAPSPWRGPSDYMKVSSFSMNTIRDATDPALLMVAVDLRLTFARGLPLPFDIRILQRLIASAESGPGG